MIICDIGLPDIDGYHVARELRDDAGFSSTRLIALTGYARPEDKRGALRRRASTHTSPSLRPSTHVNALVAVH